MSSGQKSACWSPGVVCRSRLCGVRGVFSSWCDGRVLGGLGCGTSFRGGAAGDGAHVLAGGSLSGAEDGSPARAEATGESLALPELGSPPQTPSP